MDPRLRAYLLARATHAPDLVWAASSIAVDPHPPRIPESTLSDSLWDGAVALSNSPFDFWAWAQGGHYNTFAFRGAQIASAPNVVKLYTSSEPKVAKINLYIHRQVVAIKKSNGFGTISQRARPDLYWTFSTNAFCLNAGRILVDGDDLAIRQQADGFGSHLGQIISCQ